MILHRGIGLKLVGVVAAVLAAGAMLTWWAVQRTERQMRNELLQQARLVAQAVSIERVKALSGGATDLEKSDYQRLKEQFAAVKMTNGKYRFVYLLGRNPSGELFIFVDNEPPDSEDYSPPGQLYEEASANYRRVFETRMAVTAGPVTDRWGTWVSALIPLIDPKTGDLIAVLGMDIDSQTWKWDLVTHAALPVGLMLAMLVFILLSMALARAHSLTRDRETELLESEKKFRHLFERAEEGIMIMRGETIEFANPALIRILGRSIDTITASPFATFIHPEDRDRMFEHRRRRMQENAVDTGCDFKIAAIDGEVRWLRIKSQSIDWEGGPATLSFLTDITQRKLAEEKIHLLATTDSLTGLANRREFTRILESEMVRTKRYGTPLSLVMYDLDFFKRVNDTFGHDVGDYVLQVVTRLVNENIRTVDVAARWGGEEFMVLMPQSDLAAARNVAEKLRLAIAKYRFDRVKNITVSFGVTEFAPQDNSASLLKRVDAALYQAKAHGRNCVEVWIEGERLGRGNPNVVRG